MPKVMLIEDDPTMLALLNTLLRIEGYEVVDIENEEQALEEISREQPDLILLDVHLAKADGLELVRELRQRDDLKHLRVLMSSGMDFMQNSLDEGADDFILKPYMPDELIAKIKKLLQN